MQVKCAHESKPLRRGAGAESPTFDFYSATGGETEKGQQKLLQQHVSLMIWGRVLVLHVFRANLSHQLLT